MDHLIIRNADLNSTDVIRLPASGSFTQASIGRSPFALSDDGTPRDLGLGDVLWIAQAGYGVVAKARIAGIAPEVTITSLEDIEALRRAHRHLAATYWDDLRDRLAKARETGKPVKFIAINYDQADNLPLNEQFRLVRERGMRSSWISFRDQAAKAKAFAMQGTSVSSALQEDEAGDYGAIPDKIRWAVIQVWKTRCVGERQSADESCEFDHFVPRALGGPGILLENVIPLPKSLNRAKSHRVPASFPTIAYRWSLLTDDERRSWGDPTAEGELRRRQEQLTRRVTAAVRKLPVDDQRRFYFEVLEAGVGTHVRAYFAEAGVPVSGRRQ